MFQNVPLGRAPPVRHVDHFDKISARFCYGEMTPPKQPVVCFIAMLQLAFLGTPAAADCRAAPSSDAIYTGVGRPKAATNRSPRAQNDPRSGFAGLLDPNRDAYDPGKANYGSKYGENYGGAPGSTNDQASTFLGTPCGPPLAPAL